MCRALRQRGYDALITTTDADGATRLPVPIGHISDWNGVPTLFFPRQWSEALKFSWPLAQWLARHVAEFDVVHVHAVFSHACIAAACASIRRTPRYQKTRLRIGF